MNDNSEASWIDSSSQLYLDIRERTKQKEGSASSSHIKNPVSLANLSNKWQENIANTRLQGSTGTGAYFDSRGYLTTGHGSLISKNKPGSPSHKMDIVKWINRNKDILGAEASSSDSLTSLYSKVRNISQDQADSLLDNDLQEHIHQAKILSQNKLEDSFNDLSDNEKKVIVDMTFNLGKQKYSKFTEFWKAVKGRDFSKAAYEIENSDYYNQVGDRAVENIQMITDSTPAADSTSEPTSPEPVTPAPPVQEDSEIPMQRPEESTEPPQEHQIPFTLSKSLAVEVAKKRLSQGNE